MAKILKQRIRINFLRGKTNTWFTAGIRIKFTKYITANMAAISDMRKQYDGTEEHLDIENLASREPFGCFRHWFDIACNTKCIGEPNAMTLATATKEGKPSARVVLLKGFDEHAFQWFTNYSSRKGTELDENPYGSLLFYWCNMAEIDGKHWSRQVRIQGRVEKLSAEASTSYFHSRPKGSQIGASVSLQSTVIPNRQVLADKVKELEEKYKDSECLPRPDYWGGYRLIPERFEFWQGVQNRLHDRIVFRKEEDGETINRELTHKGDNGWLIERISP